MGISNDETTIPVPNNEDLPNPFTTQLGLLLSDSELRESAYEVFVASCRSTTGSGSPLRSPAPKRSPTTKNSSGNALGLRKAAKKGGDLSGHKAGGKAKRAVSTVGDLVRVQMGVSEHTDSRIRRGLFRVAVAQVGKRIEAMVLPLELLQRVKHTDFPNQREYEAWQKRKLKILEAGLLLHPHLPLDENDTTAKRLKNLISGALEKPIEIGKHSETMKGLQTSVTLLACRSFDGSVSEKCHWADGIPFNLCLYQMLLEACFDMDEKTSVVEEIDEVLDLLKNTWVLLGINQMLHNLCFSWVLFHRYVSTGQVETELLFAANILLVEIEKDAKATTDLACSSILSSTLNLILCWTEKSLLSYHDTFYRGNIYLMPIFVSVAVLSAKVLEKDSEEGDVARDKVDMYIRSSVHSAFSQKMEMIKSFKQSSKNQQNPLPVLSILAQDIIDVALIEKQIFTPVLKSWHPLAAGAAVAVLHSCYGNEFKRFVKVAAMGDLSPNAVLVLHAANKLERVLFQIAIEDSVESEDGGKAIIQEITPFESQAEMDSLVKSWIGTRVDSLKEFVDRSLQEEEWDPEAYKERYAPSAADVLRMIDETVEAFFTLPMTIHQALLPDLMTGLDQCLQQYIMQAKSGCGNRDTFIPIMPALTRCSKTVSKLPVVLERKESPCTPQRRKPQLGTTDGEISLGLPQQCVRINTMLHVRVELEVLVKKIINRLSSKCTSLELEDISHGIGKKFELSIAACTEGLQQLCEATAYKVVFHDLSHVFWDDLYVGEVSLARIEPFLEDLVQYLEIMSATARVRIRIRLITELMKASFEGFLFVLLAGGPSRAFTRQDADILEEDFMLLMDFFWSNGDGLPAELIVKASTTVKGILPLFRIDTESLIEQFRRITQDTYGLSAKSKLPLPPTSGKWDPTDPNTLLRVLCHRNDAMASKFLKKTFNLPKEVVEAQVPEIRLTYDSMLGEECNFESCYGT